MSFGKDSVGAAPLFHAKCTGVARLRAGHDSMTGRLVLSSSWALGQDLDLCSSSPAPPHRGLGFLIACWPLSKSELKGDCIAFL